MREGPTFPARLHESFSRFVYYRAYLGMRMHGDVAATRNLLANLSLSSGEIEELQRDKLRRLIVHAYENVPYYRRVFTERRLKPDDIREATDLPKLPLLTKEVIQRAGKDLLAVNLPLSHGDVVVNHTGGSTGQPLEFYQDAHYRSMAAGNLSRSVYMTGWRAGEPVAHVWGSEFDARRRQGLRGEVLAWARNELFLNAFRWSPEQMRSFVDKLVAFRPKLIIGYVSALTALALVIREQDLPAPRPEAIESAAETLTPTQRQLLEETFHCEVFNRYGCREVANIAHECSHHKGLHIFTDLQAVEILNDGLPAGIDQEGLIVVTNLDNYAMPFIRYVVGDVGFFSSSPCTCALPFPLLSEVTGRVSDLITTPSGHLIHGEYFSHLFYTIPGVRQFQVIQKDLEELLVLVAPADDFDASNLSPIEPTIRRQLDPNFNVRIEIVPEIPTSGSGKYRFTMSSVTPSFAGADILQRSAPDEVGQPGEAGV